MTFNKRVDRILNVCIWDRFDSGDTTGKAVRKKMKEETDDHGIIIVRFKKKSREIITSKVWNSYNKLNTEKKIKDIINTVT